MLMLVSSALKAVYTCTVYTDSQYLVKRLANTRVLEGHHGCVSRVIVYVHVHRFLQYMYLYGTVYRILYMYMYMYKVVL